MGPSGWLVSNTLAIAAVTATLQNVLDGALGAAALAHPQGVQGSRVFTARPGTAHPGANAGADLLLYRVSPNPAWGSCDLPARNEGGQLLQLPVAGLMLRFLIACFGDPSDQEPEQVLGAITAYLHANPVLTPAMIAAATASGQFPFLVDADLDGQIEPVRITPVPLADEDLNRIWSMLPAGTFGLASVYEASVVLVEQPATTAAALPVMSRGVSSFAVEQPVITSVSRPGEPVTAPIQAGDDLEVRGEHLVSTTWTIDVEGQAVPAAAVSEATEDRFRFTLPAATQAGARVLRVTHVLGGGPPPATVFTAESNPAVILVRPRVTAVSRVGTTVRVDVASAIGADQSIEVILNQQGGVGSFVLPGTLANPTRATADVGGLAPGNYLVRLRVDGVESVLTIGGGGTFNAPAVAI